MIESVIIALIYLCIFVAIVWLVLWVLGQLGVPIPARVLQIVWVIVALLIFLYLWRAFGGQLALP
jgi:hypothetical protein